MDRVSEGNGSTLSLKSVASVILKRFWIVLLTVAFTVGFAISLSLIQTPQYEASVRMLVGQDQGITNSPTEAVGLQQLTQTMVVAANSRPVAEAVIEELNLDTTVEEFFEDLTVEQVASTQFIEISYQSPDPQQAQRVANATGEAFSQQISEVSDGAAPITVVLYERAGVPDEPTVPDLFRNGTLALVFGLILGVGIALLLEIFDDRWYSAEEAENTLNVPVLAIIPVFEMASGEGSEKIHRALGQTHSTSQREASHAPAVAAEDILGGPQPGSNADVLLPAAAGDVVWPIGMAVLNKAGRVAEADATLLGMLGRSSEEVVGEDFVEVSSHPGDVERHRKLHEAFTAGERENYSIEKRLIAKSGQISQVEITVSSFYSEDSGRTGMGMVADIGRLKQAEDRLGAVMEGSPISIGFFTPDGYSLADDDGELWNSLRRVPGETNSRKSVLENEHIKYAGLDRYFRQSLESHSETVTPPLYLQPPTVGGEAVGRERRMRAFIRPVTDENGEVREVMVMLEDLTDHKSDKVGGKDEENHRFDGARTGEIRAKLAQSEEKNRMLEEKLEAVSLQKMEAKRLLLQTQQKPGAGHPSDGSL